MQKQKKKKAKDGEGKTSEADLSELSAMEDYDSLMPKRARKRDAEPRFRGRMAMQESEEQERGGRQKGRRFRR